MAPYDFDTGNPTDGFTVAAAPANERAFRSAVEGWALVEHDLNGRWIIPSGDITARNALADKADGMVFFDPVARLIEQYDLATTSWKSYGLLCSGDIKECAYDPTSYPRGWLPCDGTAYAIATYPDLHAAIGTAFGVGGAGTFRVPDLGTRVAAFYKAADADYGTIGNTRGANSVTIDKAQIPRLDVTDTHRHLVPGIPAPNNAVVSAAGSDAGVNGTATATTNVASIGSILVGAASPTAFDNRQATLVIGCLIKT